MTDETRFTLSYFEVQDLLSMDGFGLMSFARKIKNEDDAFSFAVHTGLVNLRKHPECQHCLQPKILKARTDKLDTQYQGLNWICKPQTANCSRMAVTKDTWFEDAHTSWRNILDIMLHWFFRTPPTVAAGQVGVSNVCVEHWYSKCREVCFEFVSSGDKCIGGPGLHVEIDETHLFKRKYHRGRLLRHEDVWVFGGICRETKEMFVEYVPDRRGETLWPIIQRRIAPGTIIMSDSARVYDNLHLPNRGNFEHYQVNHSRHFVDPNDRNVYTNTIERQWGVMKGSLKGILDDEQLDISLGEYVYRREHFKVSTDKERRFLGKQFQIFLNHVAAIYAGPV